MSIDEIAQFNADVVDYMECHAGMWTIRTRVIIHEGRPNRPPLAAGIPCLIFSDPKEHNTWIAKHLWDARRDKVK